MATRTKPNRTRTEIKPGEILSLKEIRPFFPDEYIVYKRESNGYERMGFIAHYPKYEDALEHLGNLRQTDPSNIYGIAPTHTQADYDR